MRRIAFGDFSIGQLEKLLETRRTKLQKVVKQRERLARQLRTLDERIRALGGQGSGAGTRPRNAKSLVAVMEEVLKGAGKPMNVGDITTAVERRGYRSSSPNFRSIVNQTLIKEKQFAQASRGVYGLKKS